MGTLATALRPFVDARAPRVYVDANMPRRLVEAMRHEFGWDVLFVLEEPTLRRASDREHFSRALDLGRTLVTLDRDFCDDKAFPPELSPGLIICSAPDETWLLRMLRHAHRTWFHDAQDVDMPLKGRKVVLTMESLH
jgi:hypothetical protein